MRILKQGISNHAVLIRAPCRPVLGLPLRQAETIVREPNRRTVRAPEDIVIAASPPRCFPCSDLAKVVVEITANDHRASERTRRFRVLATRGGIHTWWELDDEDVGVEARARAPLCARIVHRTDPQSARSRRRVLSNHNVVCEEIVPCGCVEGAPGRR